MSDIKRLEDPAQLLLDTGLLFDINRNILHPLGLALEVTTEEDGKPGFISGIWDYREDEEGMRFSPEAFKDGLDKYERFMSEEGKAKIAKRQEVLGYIVQAE